MREFVLTDASLASRAGQFAWLEINTEEPRNGVYLETYAPDALPTFTIQDPKDGRVVLRFVGSMTVAQVHAFLDNGRIAVAGSGGRPSDAEAALRTADELYGTSRYAEAAEAYRQALGVAPAGWPVYGRAVESLLYAYQRTNAPDKALELAQTAIGRLAGTPSELAVAVGGLSSALDVKDEMVRAAAVTRFEGDVRRLLGALPAGVAADDVSGAYITLLEARKKAGDEAGARRVAGEWSAHLDAAAAKAETPGQRTVFDSHRLSAYLELAQPERALPMLQQSEKDFPEDYNPPARLAVAYKELGRWAEGLAAADRALARAYGPRKLRVFDSKADILKASGDVPGARRVLQEALVHARTLPAGQRPERWIAGIEKKLAALGAPAPAP